MITLDELERTFARTSREYLMGHIRVAIELALLQVDDRRKHGLGTGDATTGFDLMRINLSGLTSRGREYVKHARTPAWRKALNGVRRSGREATTAALLERLLTGA